MDTAYPANMEDTSGGVRLEGFIEYPSATPLTLRSYSFTYQTANLATGVTIFTPTVGDVIYDIGVSVTTAFNGTTPKIDVGTFSGGNNGLFDVLAGAPVDATKVYSAVTTNAGLTSPNSHLWLQAAVGSVGAAGTAAYNSSPLIVSVANPFLVVASQSGAKGGTAITSSAGACTIHLLIGTALSF